jgi:uncharacterized protein YkwD
MGTPEPRTKGRRRILGLVAAMLIAAAVPTVAVIAAPAQQDGREVLEDGRPAPSPSALAPRNDPTELARDVVALVNAERAKEGAPALQANESLMRAAQSYSAILGRGDCFEHTCPPEPQLQSRLANAGYSGFDRIGENIAAGDETPEAVVQGWLSSPGHRRNILNPTFKDIGVGVTLTTDRYGVYWVQVFGSRPE